VRIVRLANFVGPGTGGLRTALHELGAGYLAAGHEPVLVVPGEQDRDERTGQGRVITVRGPVAPLLGGGYRVLLCRRKLMALLDSLRPDRLEVSDRTTLRWTGAWARRHGVPALMVSHESVAGLLGLAGRLRWLSGRVLGRPTDVVVEALADTLNTRTAKHYQRVVCTTRWAAAEFERLGIGNLMRIPLGVDLELFTPARRSDAVRERYAPGGEVLLVHCGRLSVEKKPHRSLDALAAVRAAGVPAVLVVAGDGPQRARMQRRAQEASLPVHFTGFLEDRRDVASLLATADVALAPGPVETFGLAALEALACGTPVVVSGASALPEVIGNAGVVVPGEDFAAGVQTVLSRPAAARRAGARERAERFGWGTAVGGFLAAHRLPPQPVQRPVQQNGQAAHPLNDRAPIVRLAARASPGGTWEAQSVEGAASREPA
jgi:alpha-1,6-mannosyltransferase